MTSLQNHAFHILSLKLTPIPYMGNRNTLLLIQKKKKKKGIFKLIKKYSNESTLKYEPLKDT